jgi:hypothetical protein
LTNFPCSLPQAKTSPLKTDGKMGLVQFEDGKVLYYPYTPSKAAGFIFMALFAVVTIIHIAGVRRYKTNYFIPMVLGGICKS